MLFVHVALLFVLLAPQKIQSQSIPHAVVKGRVLDDSTGAPLLLANVFVSNSTIGAAADVQGRFELKGVPLGTQEIVASIVGHAPQTRRLRLTDTTMYEIEFRLIPQTVQIEGVQVEAKEPKEWKRNLERFLKEFLGSTPIAEQCKVLNPEVLDFSIGGTGLFTATARAPLEIENKALGYRIRCFLDHFTSSTKPLPLTLLSIFDTPPETTPQPTPVMVEYVCRTQFIPHESPDKKDVTRWNENRRNAYFGSLRHFLTSLVVNNSEKEGFEVAEIYRGHFPDDPTFAMPIDVDTLAAPGQFRFERSLSFSGLLKIVYNGSDETEISSVQLSRPPVIFFVNGMLRNPLSITTTGHWSSQRLADMLPTDYMPDK
jgi:hypothetical protein